MTYHHLARPRDIHVIHQYEFANTGNRLSGIDVNMGSLVLTADDIGKVGRQLDNDTFWLLVSVAPITWSPWGETQAKHTSQDKGIPALATTADGNPAMTPGISTIPVNAGYVQVFVNGKKVEVADGMVTPGDCYFSGDAGATRRLIANIQVGDTLHWVGSYAGYQLQTSDSIDLDYEEN